MDGLEIQRVFLELVRLGIGHGTGCKLLTPIDWAALEDLAARQGLSAVVVDGVGKLPENMRPPKPVLLQWIGETLHGFEYRYEQYCKAIAGLASFYNKHGFKMMVLKGYACSLDWPRPEHRPCGDIDIWLFGRQKEADKLVESLKFRVDGSHHHHTVFDWGGFTVENHYDFINVYHHKSNAEFEKILKELGTFKVESGEFRVEGQLNGCSVEGCRIPSVEVCGEKVYLPSANLHALFLLKHAMMHFAAEGINLRHLLDWAFFVRAHVDEVDWSWLEGVLEQFGMRKLYDIFNAICVVDLGFDASLFHTVQFDPVLKDKVLNDIMMPEFAENLPNSLIPRLLFKYRRWKGNAWKHELCYKDSLTSAFCSGLVNHMMKPSSI